MLLQSVRKIFDRDLRKLKLEITSYQDEARIWIIDKKISNSGGNLCLHLVGNLNHFIGKILGGIEYTRDRDAEFALKNIPRSELIRMIDEAAVNVDTALSRLDEEAMLSDYPVEYNGEILPTGFFLLHLSVHLGYHLGQVNYHRRLLDVD